MTRSSVEPERPEVEALADALGIPVDQLVSLLPKPLTLYEVDDHLSIPSWFDQPVSPFGARALTWAFAGEPVLVLLAADRAEVLVAEPQVTWDGQTPRMQAISVVSRPTGASGLGAWLVGAVERAMAERSATFNKCVECGRSNPPEWMMGYDDEDICQSCAERNHGVVF